MHIELGIQIKMEEKLNYSDMFSLIDRAGIFP